jgi:hypothetical protein
MAVVDAFQHWAYQNPEEASDPTGCDATWLGLWRRFLPGVDWSGLEDEAMTGWHRKLHIYHYPFYYVEYGVAQLGAVQVWKNALEDQAKAVARYRQALSLGGTERLPALYQTAGAKFAFDAETLGEAVALIERTIEALEEEGGVGGDMEFTNLGKTGLKVSRICLGMMTYGSKQWREWVLDEEESRPFIQQALEMGINFFDTADSILSAGARKSWEGQSRTSPGGRKWSLPRKCISRWGTAPTSAAFRGCTFSTPSMLAAPVGDGSRRPVPDPPLGS